MKLLFCKNCADIFSISTQKVKTCSCGQTKGKYLDQLNAVYTGRFAIPMGISNPSFIKAIKRFNHDGGGDNFTAFLISDAAPSFRKINESEFLLCQVQ